MAGGGGGGRGFGGSWLEMWGEREGDWRGVLKKLPRDPKVLGRCVVRWLLGGGTRVGLEGGGVPEGGRSAVERLADIPELVGGVLEFVVGNGRERGRAVVWDGRCVGLENEVLTRRLMFLPAAAGGEVLRMLSDPRWSTEVEALAKAGVFWREARVGTGGGSVPVERLPAVVRRFLERTAFERVHVRGSAAEALVARFAGKHGERQRRRGVRRFVLGSGPGAWEPVLEAVREGVVGPVRLLVGPWPVRGWDEALAAAVARGGPGVAHLERVITAGGSLEPCIQTLLTLGGSVSAPLRGWILGHILGHIEGDSVILLVEWVIALGNGAEVEPQDGLEGDVAVAHVGGRLLAAEAAAGSSTARQALQHAISQGIHSLTSLPTLPDHVEPTLSRWSSLPVATCWRRRTALAIRGLVALGWLEEGTGGTGKGRAVGALCRGLGLLSSRAQERGIGLLREVVRSVGAAEGEGGGVGGEEGGAERGLVLVVETLLWAVQAQNTSASVRGTAVGVLHEGLKEKCFQGELQTRAVEALVGVLGAEGGERDPDDSVRRRAVGALGAELQNSRLKRGDRTLAFGALLWVLGAEGREGDPDGTVHQMAVFALRAVLERGRLSGEERRQALGALTGVLRVGSDRDAWPQLRRKAAEALGAGIERSWLLGEERGLAFRALAGVLEVGRREWDPDEPVRWKAAEALGSGLGKGGLSEEDRGRAVGALSGVLGTEGRERDPSWFTRGKAAEALGAGLKEGGLSGEDRERALGALAGVLGAEGKERDPHDHVRGKAADALRAGLEGGGLSGEDRERALGALAGLSGGGGEGAGSKQKETGEGGERCGWGGGRRMVSERRCGVWEETCVMPSCWMQCSDASSCLRAVGLALWPRRGRGLCGGPKSPVRSNLSPPAAATANPQSERPRERERRRSEKFETGEMHRGRRGGRRSRGMGRGGGGKQRRNRDGGRGGEGGEEQ